MGYSPWGLKESDMTEIKQARTLTSVSKSFEAAHNENAYR